MEIVYSAVPNSAPPVAESLRNVLCCVYAETVRPIAPKGVCCSVLSVRFRANWQTLARFQGLLLASEGHMLALTALYVQYSLESGSR